MAMVPMFVSPPKVIRWEHMPKVMILGGAALGGDEIRRLGPSWMGLVPL